MRSARTMPATVPGTAHRPPGLKQRVARTAAHSAPDNGGDRGTGTCACGGTCPRCQANSHGSPALLLSKPGDPYESEAHRVARQVMPGSRSEPAPKVSTTKINHRVSSSAATTAGHSATAPPIVHETLKAPGRTLGTDTRSMMEPQFGRSLADVQVHTDAKAAVSADAVDARAYTVGRHVVFGRGEFAPDSSKGQSLLAHELTHVVQQSGQSSNVVQRQPKASPPSDRTSIDPKNLSTLGPGFTKPETEVRKLGLKEMRLVDSFTDPDFMLFWAQNSTVPLRKLSTGLPLFSTGTTRGGKTLVWTYVHDETNMVMGFVKSTLLLDKQVADLTKRQQPLFKLAEPDLTPPNLSPPAVAKQPSYKNSWSDALGLDEPSQPANAPPATPGPDQIDWKKFRKIVSTALTKHNNIAWDAFGDVYDQRNSIGRLVGEPDPCLDPNLAAADHYLFARSLVMDFGYPAIFVKMMNAGYTPFKDALKSRGFDPALGKCPTSPGTIGQQLAGDMGADSGSLIGHPENWDYKPFGKDPPAYKDRTNYHW